MTKQRFLSLVLVVVFGCVAASAQEFTFQTFSIPQNTGALAVDGINDFGTTSGNIVDSSGNTKAFVRDSRGNVNIFVEPRNTATPSYTRANHINDLGVVVGDYVDTAANSQQGFFEFAGKFQSYTVPGAAPGAGTSVDSINNLGSFCGFVGTEAFVTVNGKATVFNVDSSIFSFCEDINDLLWTVGGYQDSSNLWHGWIRTPFNSVITTYDAPGASTSVSTPASNPCNLAPVGGSRIYGINNLGEIAGQFWDKSFVEHGFVLYPGGKFVQIDVPGAISSSLGSINNLGQITGHYIDASCNNLGYIATPKNHNGN